MNLKITIAGDLICDSDERRDFMGIMHGNNAFWALSDLRTFLRDKIKYNENEEEIQIYEKCLENFNSCLDGHSIYGIFYDFFQ